VAPNSLACDPQVVPGGWVRLSEQEHKLFAVDTRTLDFDVMLECG